MPPFSRLPLADHARPLSLLAARLLLCLLAAATLQGCILLGGGPGKGDGGPVGGGEGGGPKAPRLAWRVSAKPAAVKTGLDALAALKKGSNAEVEKLLDGKRVGVLANGTLLEWELNAASLLRDREGTTLAAIAAAPPNDAVAAPKPEGAPANAPLRAAGFPKAALALPQANSPRLGDPFWDAIDVLVVDLQLTGLRSDAALTILASAMEDAYLKEKPLLLLDRPNPLGGLTVAGPIQDPEHYTRPESYYPMPIQHGMTTGEAARLFNDFFGAGAETTVLELDGWTRGTRWSRNEMEWTPLAPSLATYEEYLAWCALSLGGAAGLEFRDGAIGAPRLDGAKLAAEIETAIASAGLGPEFAASMQWTPVAIPPAEEGAAPWGGASLAVLDERGYRPVEAGVALLRAAVKSGRQLDAKKAGAWIGSAAALKKLSAGAGVSDVASAWEESLRAFQLERLRSLIYKR